jgi:adenosylhomocysteine nucleosidase
MTGAEESRTDPRVRALPRTCVLFALPQERKAFKLSGSPDLRVAHSGAGPANAGRVASGILAAYADTKPLLIICGFGGAITPALKPGDLIIAESIVDATEGLEYPRERLIPDPRLTALAMEQRVSGARLHKSVLVTTNRVLITAHEKREWKQRTGAVAVDMESAAAASAAVECGAKWISVRAITDDAEQDLPLDFNRLTDEHGNISSARITMAVLLRPWAVPGLMRLGKNSTLAGKNLALFLESFLRRVPLNDFNAESGE